MLMTILDVEVDTENIQWPKKKFLIELISCTRFPTIASLNISPSPEGGMC